MAVYQLSDQVRLFSAPIQSGVLTIGLTVRVTVYLKDTGAILLNNQALSSAGNGTYYYVWTHGRTVKSWLSAVYTVSGLLSATAMTEDIMIDDSQSLLFFESGRAT